MDKRYISTRKLNDGFLILYYDSIEIIVMSCNHFINISALLAKKNKDFNEWLKIESFREIIDTLDKINYDLGQRYCEEPYGASHSSVIIEVKASNLIDDRTAGFYVHKDLIPYILTCISIPFSLKVVRVLDTYIGEKLENRIKLSQSMDLETNNSYNM
ncbi:N1R/p28 family protein [Fowlpox virus]|uniref:ORF FPV161 N1R/p28 gene family protein n=2 Tax=Fowlpox virus TaxID=10261 RepID=Q9J570_FOWPN|nr:N1R/p28 gene family protein [Fowlpox virus]UNS14379.1 ALPV-215 [Albatrosspox virus]WPD90869.1 N1R/p28 family protein [Avipoxvirus sp.]CAE52698.1 hypothetical protein [Fowlpox virus isolate HP-438/Munich]AAF44505.1 ORF FPV161 N1R/p28 gene family protein [Fowlpox virus]AYO89754.1 N1R/p28 family protein [Fowlpox virus]